MRLDNLIDKQPVLRMMPMPSDINHSGNIFGGWIMAQVDLAGGIAAMNRAKGRVATVAVNSFTFKEPVLVGDVVSFYANINKVGKTSIEVFVEVYTHRKRGMHEAPIKVTEAILTYVALDENGNKRNVDPSLQV